MKRSSLLLTLLGILLISFVLTGFQCGSPSLTSAKLYIKNSDWEGAEKSLTTEVEKNPANAEAWYLLGEVRKERGNYEGMLAAFDKSLKASTEFAKKIDDTRKSVWQKSMARAINSYNQSINASKDSASILRQSSIADYKTAIMINPDSIVAYQNMAIAQHVGGMYEEEISSLKMALERKKDHEAYVSLINAYIRKAETAKSSGNNDEAGKSFNDAITTLTDARALQPENIELLGTLINLYIESDRAKEALPFIREAITKDPKNKVFQNDLGLLLMQTGEFEEATQHFEAAVAADENYEDGLWNGAVAYMKLGDKIKKESDANADSKVYVEKFKSAVKLAEKLVMIKKDEAKYWTGLGTAYANANMQKQAQKAFEQADALGKK